MGMRVMHVVGARPNFMKVAPLLAEMARAPDLFEQTLIHTEQHYDDALSKVFFDDLGLPRPDVHLGVRSGSHAQQTARVMLAFEPVLLETRPDWVVVVGDVNSTVACALTAAKLGVRVAHVEAGLRSFDRTMPEEINRIVTDQLADLLFTTESAANENLRCEGFSEEKIVFAGNVMIDTLVRLLPKAEARWQEQHATEREQSYILVTLHRPSNVDHPKPLQEIMLALGDLAREWRVLFPVHPRTHQRIDSLGLQSGTQVELLAPLGYLDFLALMRHAALVVTDSGGVQEETTYLGVPCLTVRPNTERPVTLELGTNRLVASERSAIVEAAQAALCVGSAAATCPPLWDGKAASRIAKALLDYVPR